MKKTIRGRLIAFMALLGLVLGMMLVATPAQASASAPAWWNGTTCDTNNYPGSYALGASYNGVIACGPGPAHQGGSDHLVHFFSGAWGEYEWECVELVMRYMYLVYGINPYSAMGDTVVSNYSGTVLTKITNNGTSLPSPGDIVSESVVHTGVVTAVNVTNGSGTVTIMEENGPAVSSSYNGYGTINVVGGVLQSSVTGWLHNPNSTSRKTVNTDLNRDGVPDIFTIQQNDAGSNSTAVRVINGVNMYQWVLQGGTVLSQTGTDTDFAVDDYNHDGVPDIYAIQRNDAGSNSVAIRIINGANPQQWLLQTGTILGQTSSSWDFKVADANGDGISDLYAIDRHDTGSNSTAVHILNGGTNFSSWILQSGTLLGQTDSYWRFD